MKLFSLPAAEAHCDIPCGIYDPHLAQVAALTTVRMNQLIADQGSDAAKLSRYIATKEEHAELCKHELRVLWADYFKPEHLEKHPNLHTLVFNALKTASKVRQEVNADAAAQLLSEVNEIARIFWDTKGVATASKSSNQAAGGEFVVPA
jgi:nickel superoxide dismutase